jgi:hypothetical protein
MGYKTKTSSGVETKGAVRKAAVAQTKAGRNSGGHWTGRRNLLWTADSPGVNYVRLSPSLGREGRARVR